MSRSPNCTGIMVFSYKTNRKDYKIKFNIPIPVEKEESHYDFYAANTSSDANSRKQFRCIAVTKGVTCDIAPVTSGVRCLLKCKIYSANPFPAELANTSFSVMEQVNTLLQQYFTQYRLENRF